MLGVDSSEEMVRAAPEDAGVEFTVGDIRDWPEPGGRDGRRTRLERRAAMGPGPPRPPAGAGRVDRPGGWLALQVPGNFEEPSHTIRRDLAAEPAYVEHTAAVAVPEAHDASHLPRVPCATSGARWTPGRPPTCTCSKARTRSSPGSAARRPPDACRRCPTTCAPSSRRSSSGAWPRGVPRAGRGGGAAVPPSLRGRPSDGEAAALTSHSGGIVGTSVVPVGGGTTCSRVQPATTRR